MTFPRRASELTDSSVPDRPVTDQGVPAPADLVTEADVVTEAEVVTEVRAAEESGPGPDSMPTGIWIDVRVPGKLDRARLRTAASTAGRLMVLSTSSIRLPGIAAAVVASAWAAAVGLLCAIVLAVLSGAAEPGPHLASLIWLTSHHAPLATEVGTVTLLPLGLMLITVLPLRRAGRFVAAQVAQGRTGPLPPRNRLLAVCGVAVAVYTAVAGVVAASDLSDPHVPVLPAMGWAIVVAGAAGTWGVVRQLRGRVPTPPFAQAVAVAVAVPLGLATLLTAATLLLGLGSIADVQGQVAQTGAEQVGISVLQLAYLPNVIIWAASFVIGTGFSLGADHRLSPFASGQPVVPDLPILTVVPVDPPNSTALLPILVALGGVLGAVLFARALPEARLRRRITRALAIALAAGAVWWLLMALSGGSLGDGRLDSLGPAPGTVLVAVLLTGAGTMLWALLPTLASDAKPVAVDLRDRVSTAASAAKEVTNARRPTGKRG